MNTVALALDPIIYDFDTEEAALRYDDWFHAKIQKAINSTAPRLPHDEAMAEVKAMLEERRKLRALSQVE